VDRYWERGKECRAAVRQFARCVEGQECVWPEISWRKNPVPNRFQVEPACLIEWDRTLHHCLGYPG
jgi:hypothetical protein